MAQCHLRKHAPEWELALFETAAARNRLQVWSALAIIGLVGPNPDLLHAYQKFRRKLAVG